MRIERNFGAVESGVDEGDDLRFVEGRGCFQAHLTNQFCASLQPVVRIGEAGALKKK